MRYLLILLVLCGLAFGATTYYVDPGVVGGSADGSSWANAYSALNTAENARDADITGVAGGVIFECRCSTAANDTAAVDISGWTTDSDSPVTVQSTDGTYKLVVTDADALLVREDYVILKNLYIETTGPTASGTDVIHIYGQSATNNLIQISHCTLKGHANASYYQIGISEDDANTILRVWNTLIYNFSAMDNTGNCPFKQNAAGSTSTLYNCTFSGGKYAYSVVAGAGTLKNCLGVNALTYSFFTDNGGNEVMNCTNCMADDGSFAAIAFDTETNCTDSASNIFTGVFRLAAGDDAIDAGADLSGDTPAVTDDIDGTARGATYDIGCDEYVSSGYVHPNFNGGFEENNGGFDQ